MLRSYVCRPRRTRLLRCIAPARTPQWQPRATFISLRNQKSQSDAESEREPEQAPAQSKPEAGPEERQNAPRIQYMAGDRPQQEKSAGRYSRLLHDDVEKGIQPPSNYPGSAEHTGVGHAEAETSVEADEGYATAIDAALSKGLVYHAWRLFEDNYTSRDCKALTDPPLCDVPLLHEGKTFLVLLSAINASFCKGRRRSALPTPTAALFKFEQLGIARSTYWTRQTLSYLTHQAIQIVNAIAQEPHRNLPSLLQELLSVWRLFFQCKGQKHDPLESISTEWQLPAIESLPPPEYEIRDFSMRLQEYHPQHVRSPSLGFSAVYLYTISDALKSVESLQEQATPFLQLLEHILPGAHVGSLSKHMSQAKLFNDLPVAVQKQIREEIDSAPRKAMLMLASSGKTLSTERQTDDAAANLMTFYLKRIARAVDSESSPLNLDKLWKQVEIAYTSQGQKAAIPNRIYNAFLSGFLTLYHPQRSVDIWNHMIAHDVKPDMQCWVALLTGCVKAKDYNGFNAIWTRMLSTGVEPDNYVWTCRVNGLITLNQINLGLAALDEMGKRWLLAEDIVKNPRGRNGKRAEHVSKSPKAVNNCAKPSVQVINGAISSLVQIRNLRLEKRIGYVQRILRWAGNFEVKPDIITYNTLIQLYMNAGDHEKAFRVLRQMEKDGIQADMTTHTMLLTASFNNERFDDLSAAEQTERILALFDSLEGGGIKLNGHFYAVAIDRLLKQYSNHEAVRPLLDHMTKRNLRPSPHLYTSIITYYFRQSPPAIAAVDSFVQHIFSDIRAEKDRLIYDRLVEEYARNGEVRKAMSLLTKMSTEGLIPRWNALKAVVKALVQDGDKERAQALVRDMQRGEGVAQAGIRGGLLSEQSFYHMLDELGIDWEESDVVTASNEDIHGFLTARSEPEQKQEQPFGVAL